MHGFSSIGHAIVQEVSTANVIEDPDHDDPEISKLDPMRRKTIIESG
jgi:hypothetical protein